jgi:hypothetical protein
MYKVFAKNPNFRGQLAGVFFYQGVAEVEDDTVLEVLQKLGCRVKDMDAVSDSKYTIYSQNDGYNGVVGGLMFIMGEAHTDDKSLADSFRTMRQFRVEENKTKQTTKKSTKSTKKTKVEEKVEETSE